MGATAVESWMREPQMGWIPITDPLKNFQYNLSSIQLLSQPCFTHLLSYFSFRLALNLFLPQCPAKNNKKKLQKLEGIKYTWPPLCLKLEGTRPMGDTAPPCLTMGGLRQPSLVPYWMKTKLFYLERCGVERCQNCAKWCMLDSAISGLVAWFITDFITTCIQMHTACVRNKTLLTVPKIMQIVTGILKIRVVKRRPTAVGFWPTPYARY